MIPEGPTIDLNADLGEGFPHDDAILARVTSASICCGAHASDPATIVRTLHAAAAHRVVVGAHPGYADRANFGREVSAATTAEVEALIRSQFADLDALARSVGVPLRFVKPHGALYHQAQREPAIALGVVRAMVRIGLPLVGMPGSLLEAEADRVGVPFRSEGFPERRYRPDGSLAPRGEPGAVLDTPEAIASQAVALARRGLATLCVHGDAPHAVEWADVIREALARAGVAVRSGEPPWA